MNLKPQWLQITLSNPETTPKGIIVPWGSGKKLTYEVYAVEGVNFNIVGRDAASAWPYYQSGVTEVKVEKALPLPVQARK